MLVSGVNLSGSPYADLIGYVSETPGVVAWRRLYVGLGVQALIPGGFLGRRAV